MAKRKVRRKVKAENEFGEEIETEQEVEVSEDAPVDETFAESAGLPANKHAKLQAQKDAANKKKEVPHGVFYTMKDANKVIKVKVKLQGVYEVYVGNMKRHKDGLVPAIKNWKAKGAWCEPHEVKDKIVAIRAELAAKAIDKKKGK